MKQLVIFIGILLGFTNLFAQRDTVILTPHTATHMNWYGNYDQPIQFPTNVSYEKIKMKVTLGCPSNGCSDWDYTTKISLREHTGIMDSSKQGFPFYSVNGSSPANYCFSLDTTRNYFASNGSTDSTANAPIWIYFMNDAQNQTLITDSMKVWPANYQKYIFLNGTKIDSIFEASDSCLVQTYDSVYVPFEVIKEHELGRLITPYGGNLPTTWNHTWEYDVTDFAPLLKGNHDIRVFYDGWSDGFTISTRFEMIKGTPPANVIRFMPLWNGYFEYGNLSNDIENHLVPMQLPCDTAFAGKIRVVTTGHSFGGNQNCAEFCHKYHQIVAGNTGFTQDLWRYDCGLNPIFPQAGTWLYDRAGWCPGSNVRPFDFDISAELIQNTDIEVDYNMALYTYTGGAGFHPAYYITSYAALYGTPNFQHDASIEEIIQPSLDKNYSRINPICQNPTIVIKNTGAQPLSSLVINYGVTGTTLQTYTWTGNLAFLDTAIVSLPAVNLDNGTSFQVVLGQANGNVNEYSWNDTLQVSYAPAPILPNKFVFNWSTNAATFETTYQVKNLTTNAILYTNGTLTASTVYTDTMNLAPGYYELLVKDAGKDGLSFYNFNSDGSGFARIKSAAPFGPIIKNFDNNFGTEIRYQFRVDVTTAQENWVDILTADVYPNPSSDIFTIQLSHPIKAYATIMDLNGKIIKEFKIDQSKSNIQVSDFPNGMYLLKIDSEKGSVTKQISVIH